MVISETRLRITVPLRLGQGGESHELRDALAATRTVSPSSEVSPENPAPPAVGLTTFRLNQTRTTGSASSSREPNLFERRVVYTPRDDSRSNVLGSKGVSVVATDDRAREERETAAQGFEAPPLPEPLPRENLEPREPDDARVVPQPLAGQPPAQRSGKRLMLVAALLLVLIELAWVVAISLFIYRTVT
jgi:hypothetical protein